jgi:hypothetical protein
MDLDAAVSSHLREGLLRAVDELQLLVSSGGKQLLPKSASVVDRKRFQVQRIAEVSCGDEGGRVDDLPPFSLDETDGYRYLTAGAVLELLGLALGFCHAARARSQVRGLCMMMIR